MEVEVCNLAFLKIAVFGGQRQRDFWETRDQSKCCSAILGKTMLKNILPKGRFFRDFQLTNASSLSIVSFATKKERVEATAVFDQSKFLVRQVFIL